MPNLPQPYRDVADSGQDWLGAVPSHWSVLPHRSLFREVKNQDHADEELLSVTISRGVIRQAEFLKSTSKKDSSNLDKSKYKLVEQGDLAYNKMRAWQGAIGVSVHRGIVSPAYVVQRLRVAGLPRYFHHLFRTPAFATEAERWSYGITSDQWSLRPEHFKMIYSCVPPIEEQAAVVRYVRDLDHRINTQIRHKRRLIALLREQPQAIVDNAVTRGADPNVVLEPTTLEYLDLQPVHWRRSRLKFESEAIVDCLHATPTYLPDGLYPAIRTADIEPGHVRLEQAKRIGLEEFERWTARLRPREGDVLYSREGVRFGIAAPVPADINLCISQRMMLVRIHSSENSRYMMWQLNCRHVYQQAVVDNVGAGAPHVNIERIRNYRVLVPPRGEQDAIVERIDSELFQLNRAIDTAEREINLILEYRTRLVADVVTGKADVREMAADLPDRADDLEILDDVRPGESGERAQLEPEELDEVLA